MREVRGAARGQVARAKVAQAREERRGLGGRELGEGLEREPRRGLQVDDQVVPGWARLWLWGLGLGLGLASGPGSGLQVEEQAAPAKVGGLDAAGLGKRPHLDRVLSQPLAHGTLRAP